MAKHPPHQCDTKRSALWVIAIVGAYSLISLVGCFAIFWFLASKSRAIPVEQIPLLMGLSASGGAAITGLLGLLGRTSQDPVAGTPTNPTTTIVANTTENPAQVEINKP